MEILQKKKKICLPYVVVFIFFVSKLPFLRLPFFWDEIPNISQAIRMIPVRNNLFSLIIRNLFTWGVHQSIHFHLIILVFAILCLLFTYKLSFCIWKDYKISLLSIIFLACSPLFYAQSGILNASLVITLFWIISVYYYIRRKVYYFLVSLIILCLIKENMIIFNFVFLVQALFMCFFSKNEKAFYLRIVILLSFLNVIGLIVRKIFIPPLIWNFYFSNIQNAYFLYITKTIEICFEFFRNSSLWKVFISLCLIKTIFYYKGNIQNRYTSNQKYLDIIVLLFLSFIFFVIFHSVYNINLIRYWLFLYPFIAILIAWLIVQSFQKTKSQIIITMCVMIYMISNHFFPLTQKYAFGSGAYAEASMGYCHIIHVHKKLATYVENYYKDKVVGAAWPLTQELRHPYLGYVETPLKVRDVFAKFRVDGMSSIFNLDSQDVDVIVYSSQSDNSAQVLKYLTYNNWKEIKSFKSYGAEASIYLKE